MNSQQKQFKRTRVYVLVLDCILIFLSVLSSWTIRSKLPSFFFNIERLYVIIPYVICIRIIINSFFEHYSLSFFNLNVRDIRAVFWHNILPSLIFAVIRLASPIAFIKMSFSMIFSEYVITVTGMVLIRLLISSQSSRRTKASSAGKTRSAVIVGNLSTIAKEINLEILEEKCNLSIYAILTQNTIDWNTDFKGIRVFGGYDTMGSLVSESQHISVVLICGYHNNKQKIEILNQCRDLADNIYHKRK